MMLRQNEFQIFLTTENKIFLIAKNRIYTFTAYKQYKLHFFISYINTNIIIRYLMFVLIPTDPNLRNKTQTHTVLIELSEDNGELIYNEWVGKDSEVCFVPQVAARNINFVPSFHCSLL